MSVTCGNCTKGLGRVHGCQIKHDTIAEVRDCYARTYNYLDIYENVDPELLEDQARSEIAAEIGYERHLETRDWAEQAAFEDYEARLGKISYEEARDLATEQFYGYAGAYGLEA
jgi:hypothetical protein